jgi:hypothetical protein
MLNKKITTDPTELRISPRISVSRPVQIRNQNVTMMYAISTDVSQHGLGILASRPLLPGQCCTFSFEVKTGGSSRSTITVDGTVCYNHPVMPRGVRIGIKVSKVHPSTANALMSFLKST